MKIIAFLTVLVCASASFSTQIQEKIVVVQDLIPSPFMQNHGEGESQNVAMKDLTLAGLLVAKTDQSTAAQKKRVIATCSPIYWKDDANWVSPETSANSYIQEYERSLIKHPSYKFPSVNDVKLVKAPTHGRLEITADNARNAGNPSWTYYPNPGFIGTDRIEFDVQVAGITIRSIQILKINKILTEDLDARKLCGYIYKKISQSGQPGASSTDYTVWQRSAQLSALIASAQQTLTGFADLPATALGQTVGEGASAAITLDTNAAGHGWYVDPTPLDNSDDYLPTSESSVWQAKAGSAAANRMDMLSVLLHEYGHALGLEHSAEAGDFMNASLQPGMRKMPTAESQN